MADRHDMVERCAKLYISEKDASRQLEPDKVWENIPDKVWVAVAFKRNSKREAVLMPCIHWHQKNMGNGQHNLSLCDASGAGISFIEKNGLMSNWYAKVIIIRPKNMYEEW